MIERWHVVFSRGSGTPPWWLSRMSPAWRHCWMFGFDYDGPGWVQVNPAFNLVGIGAMHEAEVNLWLSLGERGRVPMLRIAPQGHGPHRPRLFGALTCAGVIAHIIGLPETAWTPRALYRHLIRAGAVPAAVGVVDGKHLARAEDFGSGRAGGDRAGGCGGFPGPAGLDRPQ